MTDIEDSILAKLEIEDAAQRRRRESDGLLRWTVVFLVIATAAVFYALHRRAVRAEQSAALAPPAAKLPSLPPQAVVPPQAQPLPAETPPLAVRPPAPHRAPHRAPAARLHASRGSTPARPSHLPLPPPPD